MPTSESDIVKAAPLLLKQYGSLTTSEVKQLLHTVIPFDKEDLKPSKSRPSERSIDQKIGNVVSHQAPNTVVAYEQDTYVIDKTVKPAVWSILTGLKSNGTLDTISKQEAKKRKTRKRSFQPRKIEWDDINDSRSELGRLGEEFVIRYETNEVLKFAPMDTDRIIHLSEEQGDGAGFDIISLNRDGSDKYIEVKTTEGKIDTPFYMTSNELAFFKMNKDLNNTYLYRVYNFDKTKGEGKVKIIPAKDLISKYEFDPISFKVSLI